MPDTPIVIVGGGAAGLSAAAALTRAGFNPLVLEKDKRIGAVWERRYDRLRLHTVYSSLAHLPLPRHSAKYPSKDEYAAYLRAYARHFNLRIIAGCPVSRVERSAAPTVGAPRASWLVRSDCGDWRCAVVIVATGQYGVPILPAWPGRETYRGQLLHSAEYRNPQPFVGKRVLVVGSGNSGAEIATDLAEGGAATVAISVRTSPPITLRDPFGMPVQRTGIVLSMLPPRLADRMARWVMRLTVGDLRPYGLAPAAWYPYSARSVPLIDVGFLKQLKAGRVQTRPGLAQLTADGVIFSDARGPTGPAEPFDAIIAATGFGTGLKELLDAPELLDERNEPAFPSGQPTSAPGLYFIGYTHTLRGHLYEANVDSRRLANHVAAYLR
jgi:putative flavoprotein involved in K+ transport